MFMSVVELKSGVEAFGDLAGARVLITGLTSETGVDVARVFAEHKGRLIVQSPSDGPEITEIAALLSSTATDLRLFTGQIEDQDGWVRLAQTSAQAFGGLDAVVNLISISAADLAGVRSEAQVEELLSRKLLPATLLTRIAANRMRLTLTRGSVLNVVLCEEPRDTTGHALIGVIRATLATMTRREAQEWAQQEIRVNAVGPKGFGPADRGAVLGSEPDVALLALHLASKKGRNLSGCVFDVESRRKSL
jgi:3-oxoacyl-[acyl-carrier protein] reductase